VVLSIIGFDLSIIVSDLLVIVDDLTFAQTSYVFIPYF